MATKRVWMVPELVVLGTGGSSDQELQEAWASEETEILGFLLLNITVSNTTVAFIIFLDEMRHVELLPGSRW